MTCDNVKAFRQEQGQKNRPHAYLPNGGIVRSVSVRFTLADFPQEETPLDSDLQTIEDEEGVGSDDSITCEENESDLDNESLETGDIAVEILEREEVSDDGNELDLNELDGSSGSDSGFSDSSNQEC
ncbi:hypothetical protein PC9H_008970 [Pleurotus ostreatus]|uniref:Uncharacterized protein n=2 Tax=Pleurotus ostreatus TaxID=5322 RepID=A0A067NWU4_PLEO1|nr:uncharacterized protein PC9H_008970 [Pleurotus ostreatus]KAF7426601.1 hypothetical protein PC9H_008970 [Pleurotus ostreatus]KDQ32349.1 hypothetical protein PLEOSDRAFT_1100833 [Pleurotus ostreatus PC15]